MNLLRWFCARARRRRTAAALASLQAGGGLSSMSELVEVATAEPDPGRIHLALIEHNMPPSAHPSGWVPTLEDLGALAELAARFGDPDRRANRPRVEIAHFSRS